MSLKDFQILSKLGLTYLYPSQKIEDNTDYALKKVNLKNLSGKEKQNALYEVKILASIKHPHIISYKEAFIDTSSNSLCIIMELADNGDLYQQIVKCIKTNTLLPEHDIIKIIYQVASGLKVLHNLKIFHGNIQNDNLFFQSNGDIKLGDIDAPQITAMKRQHPSPSGTPYYASPEVWKDQPYHQKSDVWSLGCVAYELAALKPPFCDYDLEGLYKKVIKEGLYPSLPPQYSHDFQNIIRMMLQVKINLRPTLQAILELPLFSKFKQFNNNDQKYHQIQNEKYQDKIDRNNQAIHLPSEQQNMKNTLKEEEK